MIRFRLAKISVSQFAILSDSAPTEEVTYTIGLGFKWSAEAKRIGCEFSIAFASQEKPFIKLDTFCEFDIMPKDWDSLISDDVITFRKNDLGFFANQTVGVARGIMFCKTEGTPFGQYILPPVNLESLIKEDIFFNLTDE